jgi:hypothetical protein
MICYYGQHYFSYFRDVDGANGSDCWTRYDDVNVRTIDAKGSKIRSWDDVLFKCMTGREKPILLLFEILPS